MEVSPNQIQIFPDRAIYGYKTLYGVTGSDLPTTLFLAGRQLFIVSNPLLLIAQPTTLKIPAQFQSQNLKYDILFKASCRAVLDDTNSDTLCIPVHVHEFLNTSNGAAPIKLNGSPFPNSIVSNSGSYCSSGELSTIEINEIEANISVDLTNLAPNTMFTPVASGNWFMQMFLSVTVCLYYGTNQN